MTGSFFPEAGNISNNKSKNIIAPKKDNQKNKGASD